MNCLVEPASAEIVTAQTGGGSGGSGGGSSQPAANSVGSEEIKDGSIKMEDLDPDIVITPSEARQMVADAIAND